MLATACGPIELVVPEDAGAGTDGAAALDGAAPLDAGSDAGPLPEPDPRQPCETASCWDTSAASLRCGAWSIGEDFSSGRYNVHRYRARAFAESVTRFELRMTAGSELPAIVVATTDGRILSDGAIGAPGTDPMIDVEDDGRGGGPARVAVTAAIDMELDVYVTSWSVIDSGYGAPKPTEVRYELRVADDCGPLPPGFRLAPPGAMEGELDAELAGDIVLTDAWSAPYRVDARPAEHVTFRLDFTPTSADVRWELYRYDGREPVRLAQNGAPDLMEWEGFRAVAALDQAGSRTYWIRFRRADGGSADAVLAIERVPFTDAAVCADDCARLMVLPQPNDASDGYGVPGHTIYTWQYGRRDLLMAIRHGGPAHGVDRRGALHGEGPEPLGRRGVERALHARRRPARGHLPHRRERHPGVAGAVHRLVLEHLRGRHGERLRRAAHGAHDRRVLRLGASDLGAARPRVPRSAARGRRRADRGGRDRPRAPRALRRDHAGVRGPSLRAPRRVAPPPRAHRRRSLTGAASRGTLGAMREGTRARPARARGWWLAWAMWLLPACERPPTDEPDGGRSDAALPVTGPDIPWLDAGTPPIAAPAPPSFTPCPTGWREVAPSDAEGVTTCDPFLEAGALECPDGEAHFPGEPGCAPIGAPCPAGEWPEGLRPDATVLFVRPGAEGGTGTRDAPFGTVREAIAAAPDGATIALSRGLFTESVMVDRAVTVRGACARDTSITSPEIGVHLVAAGAALEDVSIRDTGSAGLAVYYTPGARVAGVLVERANVEGVLVAEATLDARALVVRDTRPDGDGYGGAAINVTDRAEVTMGRAILERNASYAAYVDDATLVASDVVLRDTRPQTADGRRGFGISVSSAGHAELTRALVERSSAAGVLARGAGTSLVMTDSVLREVIPGTGAGEDGMGISILDAARAELTRVRVAGATDLAIEAAGIDTVIAVSDALLERSGRGAAFHTSAYALATRLRVTACGILGVGVGGAEGSLSDVSVSDTLAMSDVAVGVLVNGARAAFSRLAVDRAEGVGVMAAGASTVVLEDSTIRDTRWAPPGGDGFLSRGLLAQLGRRWTPNESRSSAPRVSGSRSWVRTHGSRSSTVSCATPSGASRTDGAAPECSWSATRA
ncbi:MAG: hypothetical protein M5U28_49215 [Sandaracinaceae bacterium]|nr:hypothetical protein [Sandaracinaceae bacterium]